jgi:hypothetical protein
MSIPRRTTPLSRNLKLSTVSGGEEVSAVRSLEEVCRYERSGERGKAEAEESTQKTKARIYCIFLLLGALPDYRRPVMRGGVGSLGVGEFHHTNNLTQ